MSLWSYIVTEICSSYYMIHGNENGKLEESALGEALGSEIITDIYIPLMGRQSIILLET